MCLISALFMMDMSDNLVNLFVNYSHVFLEILAIFLKKRECFGIGFGIRDILMYHLCMCIK